jgi:hypothetical protein
VTAREWSFPLPFVSLLTLNDRMVWQKRYRLTKPWRDAVHVLARREKIPRMDRWTVVLHLAPRVHRERDLDNLAPTLKACADGVRDATGCKDDAAHYTPTNPVVHEATRQPNRLWLVVIDLTGTENPTPDKDSR